MFKVCYDLTGISISVQYDNNVYIEFPNNKIEIIKSNSEDQAKLIAKNFANDLINKYKNKV